MDGAFFCPGMFAQCALCGLIQRRQSAAVQAFVQFGLRVCGIVARAAGWRRKALWRGDVLILMNNLFACRQDAPAMM